MMNGKYSVLWFCPEVTNDLYKQMMNYIQAGIKVFFLSFDDTEELLEHSDIKEASQQGLLYLYTVRYSAEWDHDPIVYTDGMNIDESFLNFLDQNSAFNKEQYLLEHNAKPVHSIVKAGAGTGKTTTMINRIMYIKHMNPEVNLGSIVMITFTNEASLHMRTKVLERLKGYYDVTKNGRYLKWMEEIGNMFIGTIHSFAKEFLSREGLKLGFHRAMKVRSYAYDRTLLIERFIDEFSVKEPTVYEGFKNIPHYKMINTFTEMIERINNKSIPYEETLSIDYGFDHKGFHSFAQYVIENVVQALDRKKKEEEALEVSDLISKLNTMRNLPQHQFVLNIHYLFVDEFQDTDESQVSFISWLTERYQCQLFAVGDIKQSIYRFRGADYTAFNQLKNQLEEAGQFYQEYSLRKNYRSEKKLILQFNSLFHKWSGKIDKFQYDRSDELVDVREDTVDEGLVTLNMDSVNLKHLLQRLHKQDVAILVRSNRQVQEVVQQVESLGYFCEAAIAGSFYRSLPVREFYLLLRRFTHSAVPKDRYLFHRSSYGSSELTIAEILSQFSPDKNSVLDLLQEKEDLKVDLSTMKGMSTIAAFQAIIEKVKPHEVFRVRYYQKLRQMYPNVDSEMQKLEAIAKMQEYKVNLDRLIYLLKKEFGDFQASIYDFEKFLSIKMATDSTENEWKWQEPSSHRIKVMTVHKAKGMEFDFVLMPMTNSAFVKNGRSQVLMIQDGSHWKMGYYINWNDQTLENSHFQESIGDEKVETIAEEARLLYVALTRAKKGIYVNSSPSMNEHSIQCWSDLLESGERLHV